MEGLKYTVIDSREKYFDYCNKLEQLIFSESNNKEMEDEIDLLTLLIEDWDKKNSSVTELDPIQLLQSFMKDHSMKAIDLANILGISKGLVSEILAYKKGLSKEVIRKLSEKFKVNQEAFNRPYNLSLDSIKEDTGKQPLLEFKLQRVSTEKELIETLRITKNQVAANISAFRYEDKDAGQVIFYVPSLKIIGNAENDEEASKILKNKIDTFFTLLQTYSTSKRTVELQKLGWKQDLYKNKEFSQLSVNESGELEGFKIDKSKIQRIRVVAA